VDLVAAWARAYAAALRFGFLVFVGVRQHALETLHT
jgi:hypothetical protein